jgi:NitT/TauT family transport system permease protein
MKVGATMTFPAFILAALGLWGVASARSWLPSYVLPSPSAVARVLADKWELLARAALNTTTTALAGFALAVVFGLAGGLLMGRFSWLNRALLPAMVAVKSIPIVALIPLTSLILGVGLASKLFLTFLICFFPMVLSAYEGLRAVPQGLSDFARAAAVSPRQYFQRITLPGAANQLILGIKITVPLAFVGAIVSEMAGGDERGVGYLIMASSYRLDTPLLYASIFVTALISAGSFAMIGRFAARLAPQLSEET